MSRTVFSALLLLMLSFCQEIFAQMVPEKRSDTITRNFINRYHAQLGQQSPLYLGHEPLTYKADFRGSPNFENQSVFNPGWVIFNGVKYENIPLRFDEFSDLLITKYHTGTAEFVLRKDLVHSFGLLQHNFRQVIPDDSIRTNLPTGYYDILHEGTHEALVKRTREVGYFGSTKDAIAYFSPKSRYFIRKNNEYVEVNSNISIRKLFIEKRSDLQKFIRANGLNFKSDPDKMVRMVTTWYDKRL